MAFQSHMHKDFVTHTVVTKTDFIVTASRDGQLKFWKKLPELVAFAKKYKAHLGTHAFCSVICASVLAGPCIDFLFLSL